MISTKTSRLHRLLSVLLVSFPTVLLMLPAGRRFNFYALLLCAVGGLALGVKPGGKSFRDIIKKYWSLHLAMAGMLIAVLLNQAAHGAFAFKPFEKGLQLAVFPLLLWVFLILSSDKLRILQWSWVIGALLCSIALIWTTYGVTDRPGGIITNPFILFSNLTLLMGCMALLSIGWNTRDEIAPIAIKVVACALSLVASYMSGTRGSWIAVPVFILIAVSLKQSMHDRRKIVISIVSMLLLAVAMASLPYTKTRIELAYSEAAHYAEQPKAETSIGIRLQLWQASWNMFRENPVFGVGTAHYEETLRRLARDKVITPQAGSQLHSHNEFLHFMATLGTPGALAMLALYLVPGLWFKKFLRSADSQQRIAAGMGLATSLAFLAFGLTETMFYSNLCSDFYIISVAALSALIINRQDELEKTAKSSLSSELIHEK